MTHRTAFLTIGQAPRHEMSAPIERALSGKSIILHAGVLDGLDEAEIKQRFKLQEGCSPLITKSANGTICELDPHAVECGLQQKIDQLEQAGADIIVILCTGRFHTLRARRALLVEPDALVPAMLAALARQHTLGVMVPLPTQMRECAAKWQQHGVNPVLASASPYAQIEALDQAAHTLRAAGADMIVLDCMGYSKEHKMQITKAVNLPVVVSAEAVAAALSILL